jgi:hypothetical protein
MVTVCLQDHLQVFLGFGVQQSGDNGKIVTLSPLGPHSQDLDLFVGSCSCMLKFPFSSTNAKRRLEVICIFQRLLKAPTRTGWRKA